MKKMLVLLILVFVGGAVILLLMNRHPVQPLKAQSEFHFQSFTNALGRNLALFKISNHPGYLNLFAAHVYRAEAPGQWTNEGRTPVLMGSFGGMTVGVPINDPGPPVRVVFEIQEGNGGFIREIKEWLSEHIKRPLNTRPTFHVTSETARATEPTR